MLSGFSGNEGAPKCRARVKHPWTVDAWKPDKPGTDSEVKAGGLMMMCDV